MRRVLSQHARPAAPELTSRRMRRECASCATAGCNEAIWSIAAPRCRLATFAQPQPRHHGGVIGPPDARNEKGLRAAQHRACGCAEHICHARGGRSVATLSPDRSDPAGMRIDQSRRHRRPGVQTEFACGLGVSPSPIAFPGSTISAPICANPSVSEIAKSNLPEVALVPPTFMGEIGPFAGHGTDGSRKASGRTPGQKIRQDRRTARQNRRSPGDFP